MYTVSLDQAYKHGAEIGSKARNLSIMMQSQIPVPDGLVIKSDALRRFMAEHNIYQEDEKGIRERISKMEMPADIVQEIKSAFKNLTDQSYYSFAVRSSSSAEDLAGASFAGQYETFLNIQSFDRLLESVKGCWVSLFSDRVLEYKKKRNVSFEQLSMSVLVQGLIQSDISGVIFSMNPVTNDRNQIMINASYGLGEAIVSGIVTPDLFMIDKASGHIQKELGLKEVKVLPNEGETIKTVETTADEQSRFCMDDDQIINLWGITQRLEEIYQSPIDVEFAIQDGKIYILQVRPITT